MEILFPVVIVVVLLVGAAVAARRMAHRERAHVDQMRESDPHVLHYMVPNGQDPVVVTLGLNRAGFEAVEDASKGVPGELLIGEPGATEPDREKVRATLAEITEINLAGDRTASVGPVRFMDE